jgi:hypothetical protein
VPTVKLSRADQRIADRVAQRTASRTDVDPTTGAELGMAEPPAIAK